MKKQTIKQDQGVAGLTILLSFIVMLFVIGLLVMIFSIMGSKMSDSVYTSTSATSTNESLGTPTTAGLLLATGGNSRNGVCGAVTKIYNDTTGNVQIGLGNITQVGCYVYNNTASGNWLTTFGDADTRMTYTYTYDANNTATEVIGDTTSSIAGVTDWFDIFIVIVAMVVLILLTVIIITAIRSSGMVGGSSQGANSVGTA